MKKQIFLSALGAMLLASCADTFEETYTGVDESSPEYAYLKDYKPLKEYVDHAKYPNFKLGGGETASDFIAGGQAYLVGKSNFDEVVTGNAMKMASCVDDKGNMEFGTVQSFVSTAEQAGLSVYGHTLAWHSQQPIKYLSSLIADKKIEVDPDAKVVKEDYNWDYSTIGACPGWNGSPAGPVFSWGTADGLKVENATAVDPWYSLQYHGASGVNLEAGQGYKATFTVKCEGAAPLTLRYKFGNWSSGASGEIKVEPGVGFQEYEVKFTAAEGTEFLLLQHGDFVGTLWIKNIKVTHEEAMAVEVPVTDYTCTFDDGNNLGGWGNGSTREVVNAGRDGGKCHVIHNPSAVNTWECQAAIDFADALIEGETYYLTYWAKSDNGGPIEPAYQNPSDYSGRGNYGALNSTSEWQKYEGKCVISGPDCKRLCFSVGKIAGDIYIDDVEIYHMQAMNSIPLTPEEKKEVLSGAMKTWITGIMNATEGKVKAWDLINEAVSGGNRDSEGVYALQHADNSGGSWDVGGNAFYWQDYLGDIDYVRIAEAAAREAYANIEGANPSDLKLFINDYNLESDWDQNSKIKSLIAWIKRWEADGKTKIDGIGTQMHITYYENQGTLNSKKNGIVTMYKEMAKAGKLVRVSEFDMGYEDASGRELQYDQLTEEQQKNMADYWNWNIRAYLENVPSELQWGFCIWAPTDSQKGSGWRAGAPLGLWNLQWQRKHAYAGFAEGLQGKDYQK